MIFQLCLGLVGLPVLVRRAVIGRWSLENKKQLHKSKPRKEYADDDDEDEEDEGDDDDDDDEEEEEEYDDDDFLGNRLCDELMTCHLGTRSLTWDPPMKCCLSNAGEPMDQPLMNNLQYRISSPHCWISPLLEVSQPAYELWWTNLLH